MPCTHSLRRFFDLLYFRLRRHKRNPRRHLKFCGDHIAFHLGHKLKRDPLPHYQSKDSHQERRKNCPYRITMAQTTHQNRLIDAVHKRLQTSGDPALNAKDDIDLVSFYMGLEQGEVRRQNKLRLKQRKHQYRDYH